MSWGCYIGGALDSSSENVQFRSISTSNEVTGIEFVELLMKMVKSYGRKTERGNWGKQSLKNAVDVVIEGEMGYKLAAKTYYVPQMTPERKVKEARVALDVRPKKASIF
ncbi:hypothetical protein JTB14_009898 [Gonioctena quinquepunctata]|nr:hypothetical protein JTB14_009898 [Gonioctena quinquepunctata]